MTKRRVHKSLDTLAQQAMDGVHAGHTLFRRLKRRFPSLTTHLDPASPLPKAVQEAIVDEEELLELDAKRMAGLEAEKCFVTNAYAFIWRKCFQIGKNKGLSDDACESAAQAAAEDLLRKRLWEKKNVRNWDWYLGRICHNKVMDELRQRYHESEWIVSLDEFVGKNENARPRHNAIADPKQEPHTELQWLREAFACYGSHLSDKYRLVLQHKIDGLSVRESARLCDMTKDAISMARHHAKNELKKLIRRDGGF